MSLPASLADLLSSLAVCFTAPTYRTFTAMVVGLVGRTSRRTVCGMWIAAGLSTVAHQGRAHRFFSHARWSPDQLGLAVAALIVDRLVPGGVAVQAAVDDTLFHRYGRRASSSSLVVASPASSTSAAIARSLVIVAI